MQKLKFEKKIVESKKNQVRAKLAEAKGSETRHTKLPKLKSLTHPMCIARLDTISLGFINIHKESVSFG